MAEDPQRWKDKNKQYAVHECHWTALESTDHPDDTCIQMDGSSIFFKQYKTVNAIMVYG